MLRLIVILAWVAATVVHSASAVRVGFVECGGIIPIDSQYLLDPTWSLTPFRNRIDQRSNGSLTFATLSVPSAFSRLIEMEAGMDPAAVTVFVVAPDRTSSPSASGEACVIQLDPLAAAMDGVVARAARLTFFSVDLESGEACSTQSTVSLLPPSGNTSTIELLASGRVHSQSVAFASSSATTWPMKITVLSKCTVQLVILLARYGTIDRWFVWVPTTVYSGVVVALLLPVIFLRPRLPVHLAGVSLVLVFVGFLGSCIGLVMELLQWQSSVGRLFPFPHSVTLYCCLCVLYMLLFVPVLFRQGNCTVLLLGTTRLLVYGLNCALCVGYWSMGFVVLGSLALFQYLATNFVLTYYYAYVSVHLRQAVKATPSLPKFSQNFVYLWFVPVTPFACCALMYYDLYLLTNRSIEHDAASTRMRDVIRVYSAQMSLPLLFLQNVYGVALLAAACAFHMPLVVLMFVALLLCSVHLIYVVGLYAREWARWQQRGGFLSRWGCISLSAVMSALLSPEGDLAPSHCTSRGASHVVSPGPRNAQRSQEHGDQYERDIAGYQIGEGRDSLATEGSGSAVAFPPLPMTSPPRLPARPSRTSRHGHTPNRPHPSDAFGFITPPRQWDADALEYWPSSVER